MTDKVVALDVLNREALHDGNGLRLIEDLKTLSRTLEMKEETIERLTAQKNLLERLLTIKEETYKSLLQKIIEELNGSLKDMIFNSKQLFQQVGLLLQPELLGNLDKILSSAEELKSFMNEITPLSHLIVPETTKNGFSLSYLLGVLKKIIPEYFQKDLTIHLENDCRVEGDFDLLINILRQLLMHVISNIRRVRTKAVIIGLSDQAQFPIFYIKHDGIGLKNRHIPAEFPHLKKLINALGGNIWVRSKRRRGGYSYSFSFGEKYIIKPQESPEKAEEKG